MLSKRKNCLKNRSCSYRLPPVTSWRQGTNYIFRHSTTGTVPATTESWRTVTKVRITSLTISRNMSNVLFLPLFVFCNVWYHKILITDFNRAKVLCVNTFRTHKIPPASLKLAGTQLVLDLDGSIRSRKAIIIWVIIPNENIIVKINACKELPS